MDYHIIFHWPCLDGSYAMLNSLLYIALKHKHENDDSLSLRDVNFIPVRSRAIDPRGTIFPQISKKTAKLILVVDILPGNDPEILLDMVSHTEKLLWIDHHISNIEGAENFFKSKDRPSNLEIVTSTEQAACRLCLDHYLKDLGREDLRVDIASGPLFESDTKQYHWESYNRVLDYVQDHDLARSSLPEAKAVTSGIFDRFHTIRSKLGNEDTSNPYFIRELCKVKTDEVLFTGRKLYQQRVASAQKLSRNAFILYVGGIQKKKRSKEEKESRIEEAESDDDDEEEEEDDEEQKSSAAEGKKRENLDDDDDESPSSTNNDEQATTDSARRKNPFERLAMLDAQASKKTSKSKKNKKGKKRKHVKETEKRYDGEYEGALATCYALVANDRSLTNEVGQILCTKGRSEGLDPVCLIAADKRGAPGIFDVSLRSIGDYDTIKISSVFGGGGHKNASGFRIEKKEFMNWRLNVDKHGKVVKR